MNFTPVRSSLQISVVDSVGPDSYLSNAPGPLGMLQITFEWRITYLCRFHQILYADLKARDTWIGHKNDRLKNALAEMKPAIDEDDVDGFAIIQSRIQTAILDFDDDVARTKHLADEHTIIGIWATAEQYLAKVFKRLKAHVNHVTEDSVNPPSRWQQLTAQYEPLGIDLTKLDNFADADECRVLNNKIKHTRGVDEALAQYPYFAGHLNADFFRIEFQMQRYVNGVTHFIGSLIEQASQIIDPSFRA